MLRQHGDGVRLAQFGVQRALQIGQEAVKAIVQVGARLPADAVLLVQQVRVQRRRVGQQRVDAPADGVRDFGDVLGPLRPVLAVAALLDDARVNGAGLDDPQIQLQLLKAGQILRGVIIKRMDDDAFRPLLVEVQRVDFQIQALVVAAQRAQHAPDDLEGLVVVEGLLGALVGVDDHRQDDVAQLLAGRLAHDAAHGLHDVDLRLGAVP